MTSASMPDSGTPMGCNIRGGPNGKEAEHGAYFPHNCLWFSFDFACRAQAGVALTVEVRVGSP
jgi:hypothetical protein